MSVGVNSIFELRKSLLPMVAVIIAPNLHFAAVFPSVGKGRSYQVRRTRIIDKDADFTVSDFIGIHNILNVAGEASCRAPCYPLTGKGQDGRAMG